MVKKYLNKNGAMKGHKHKIKDDIEEDEEDMEAEDLDEKHISKHLKKGKAKAREEASATALRNQKIIPQHKKVLNNISENLGKKGKGNRGVSIKQAMLDKGYSESYANSGQIKKTRSWNILMSDVLNDEFLMKEHMELFRAKQVERFIFPTRLKDEEIIEMVNEAGFKVITIRPSPLGKMAFYSIANARAKKDALDFAYKLKGKFTPEEINLKFSGYNKDQLVDLIMGKIAKK